MGSESLACVASVSSRGSFRKLGQEQKTFFFAYSIGNACYAGYWVMGYWLRGHEGERSNWFSKIQLACQKYRDKTTLAG